MAADAGAGIAANIVSPRLPGPVADHLAWRRIVGYGIEILAVMVVWAVAKATGGNQIVGPVLRHFGELIRPDERRYTHPCADRIVRVQHAWAIDAGDRPWAGGAYWPPLGSLRGVYGAYL